ncbi:MAG TPA: glycosyltransferase family 4 protein [Rhizomicrobium sp.]|jgi:glycosyltransferase involved in cell wall biosynthesis
MSSQRDAAGSRPSVLFLNNQGLKSIGGGPTILRHLVRGLAQDFDVTVLSYDPPASGFDGVRQVSMPAPPRFKFWRFAPMLRAKYLRNSGPVSEIKAADVVIAFDPHFAPLLRRVRPKRFVYLSLSCVARQEWFAAGDLSGALFAAQYAWLERRIAKVSDAVIVSSTTHGEELQRVLRLRDIRLFVLYPIFDDTRRGLLDQAAQKTFVLAAGRLNPVKNYQAVIEMASRLGDLDCKFVIVGDGPELQSLQRKVAQEGLSDRVIIAGPIMDVRPLLASAILFLHPSRYESFGIAIYEAMRAGVAPVCSSTAICGIRELLTPDVDSMFVDFDRPDEAAQVLRGLLADRTRCKQIGIAALETSERVLAHDYVMEFRNVLSTLETGARAA